MKKKIAMLLSSLLVVSMLSGCGSEATVNTESNVTTTTENQNMQTTEPVNITVWHCADATIADTLQKQVDALAPEIVVTFERKENMSDALKLVGDDPESAPDMFMWAHDKVGTFAQMGILSPITDVLTEDDLADFLPMTLSAGEYQGDKYQLPLYYEALLFLYNKDLIEDCAGQCAALPPADAVRYMLERTGLTKQYRDEGSAEAAARADNLNELINDAAQFTQSNPDGTLEDYLEQVTLVNDIEAADEDGNGGAVNMMTVHSAKGLEFKNVFIAAFEDGIFPINRAFEEKDEMEEERRLAYVAVTRAKRKLYITCARQRMSHGYITESLPSRFIREIPEELLERTSARPAGSMNKGSFGYNQGMRTQYGTSGYGINRGEKRPSSGFSGASSQTATRRVGFSASFTSAAQPAHSSDASFRIGECVMHRTFGHGRIIGVKGSGADQILQIAFEGKGIKELSAAVAPIEKI